jgi:type IV secretory pathway TrbF-like protein
MNIPDCRKLQQPLREGAGMEPPRDAIIETLGFSKRAMLRANVISILSLMATLGLTGVAGYLYLKQPPVIPYVVVLDQDTKVINTIRAKPFEATDAVYADIARRWIVGIRSRSPIEPLTREVRLEAQRLSDKRIYGHVDALMKDQDEEVKAKNGRIAMGIEVSIEDMQLGPIERAKDPNTGQTLTTVKVSWKERLYRPTVGTAGTNAAEEAAQAGAKQPGDRAVIGGGSGKWKAIYCWVTMAEKPQTTTGEFEANPLHIYVIGYNFGGAYQEAPEPNATNPRVSEAQ